MTTQTNEHKVSPEAAGLLQRKQIEAMLIARCWEDEKFRKKLLADPRGTVAEAFGFELPASVTVKVQEESPNALVLSLPAKPGPAGELSDVELEQVAGGSKGAIATGKVGNVNDYAQHCGMSSLNNTMSNLRSVGQAIGYSWAWKE
jgi:hypothetical protein